jgi:hypothetical protein
MPKRMTPWGLVDVPYGDETSGRQPGPTTADTTRTTPWGDVTRGGGGGGVGSNPFNQTPWSPTAGNNGGGGRPDDNANKPGYKQTPFGWVPDPDYVPPGTTPTGPYSAGPQDVPSPLPDVPGSDPDPGDWFTRNDSSTSDALLQSLLAMLQQQGDRSNQMFQTNLDRTNQLNTMFGNQFDRQQGFIDNFLGEGGGLLNSLKDQLALLNKRDPISEAGKAAMNRDLEGGIQQDFDQADKALRVELQRRGAVGGSLPGSRGDIVRGFGPLIAGREQAMGQARRDVVLADEEQQLRSLLANRQTASNALSSGSNLLGQVATATSPNALLSGQLQSAQNELGAGSLGADLLNIQGGLFNTMYNRNIDPLSEEGIAQQLKLQGIDPLSDEGITQRLRLMGIDPLSDEGIAQQLRLKNIDPLSDEGILKTLQLRNIDPLSREGIDAQLQLRGIDPLSDEGIEQQLRLRNIDPLSADGIAAQNLLRRNIDPLSDEGIRAQLLLNNIDPLSPEGIAAQIAIREADGGGFVDNLLTAGGSSAFAALSDAALSSMFDVTGNVTEEKVKEALVKLGVTAATAPVIAAKITGTTTASLKAAGLFAGETVAAGGAFVEPGIAGVAGTAEATGGLLQFLGSAQFLGPLAIGIVGAILAKKYIGRGRRAANTWVQNIQNPLFLGTGNDHSPNGPLARISRPADFPDETVPRTADDMLGMLRRLQGVAAFWNAGINEYRGVPRMNDVTENATTGSFGDTFRSVWRSYVRQAREKAVQEGIDNPAADIKVPILGNV